jgi:hypothetical protein
MNPKHLIKGSRERKGTIIEEAIKNSLQHQIRQAITSKEKRILIAKANPLFYVFGTKRKVFKPYLTYEENYADY